MSAPLNLGAGWHDITDAAYHADPCRGPSLSCSIATKLLESTVAEARWAHPRLNPLYEAEDRTSFDLGSVAHKLVLGKGREIVVVAANDWRTEAAKAQRAAALKAGQMPCLERVYEEAQQMREALFSQIGQELLPRAADAEQTAIWNARAGWDMPALWCRSKMDLVDRPARLIVDYKTFAPGADPANFTRYLFREHRAIQDPFYSMGFAAIEGCDWREVEFRFVIQSPKPPYIASVVVLDEQARALAEQQAIWAIDRWHEAMLTGQWRGYRARAHYTAAPTYEFTKWEERMLAEQLADNLDARDAS